MPVKLFTGLLLLVLSVGTWSHGSVTADEDQCVINIGYFKAHFKIHLPRSKQHQEYCEDLPQAGEAVFIMDYIHGELESVAMDFRIIRNVTGLGRFTKLEDVEAIDDLESATVYYRQPRAEQDVFTALHDFEETGEYLGIITAEDPENQQVYSAVFPFEVGHREFGLLPLFVGLLVLCQAGYWLMSRNRSTTRHNAATALAALPLTLCLLGFPNGATANDEDGVVTSADGQFQLTYRSSLQPIQINRIHHWTLDLKTAEGEPVDDATIRVDGGMPEHDHGLATQPVVSSADPPGQYRLEGIRFHMPGAWEVRLTIEADAGSDTLLIPLDL